jgi:hypothetical protein
VMYYVVPVGLCEGGGIVADPDGPWEVRWMWNTGYSGVDRFPTSDRVIRFSDEMFRRTDPPELEIVRFSVANESTGEMLGDFLRRQQSLTSPELARTLEVWHTSNMADKTCGTCNGSGEITIIQTGAKKKCTRCDGTGKE